VYEAPAPAPALKSKVDKAGKVEKADKVDESDNLAFMKSGEDLAVRALEDFRDVQWEVRPTAKISPTKLTVVNCFRKWEVTNVNGKEMLTWEGATEMYWVDERLRGYPKASGVPATIWRPRPMGNRGFDIGPAEKGDLLPKFPRSDGKGSDGRLSMTVDWKLGGGGVNMSEQMTRFRAFPFDSLRVDMCMMLNNHNFVDGEADPKPHFEISFDRPNLKNRLVDGQCQHVDWTACRHSDDYDLVCFGYGIVKNLLPGNWGGPMGTYSGIAYSLHIARTPNFYVRKGIIPLYLVCLFGLLAFFLEPADLTGRVSVLSALFLTVYAIQWVTIERLPRLPFNTVLDSVAETVVGILILNVVGMCIAFRAGRPKEGCFGDCVDFDVDAAAAWDVWFAALASVIVVLYSIGYQIIYKRWSIGKRSGWTRVWHMSTMLFASRTRATADVFRIWTDEEWGEKHGSKFMGEGVREPPETW
jgi:hypothetical protein